MRVAVIDIGSNSTRLLIAEVKGNNGRIKVLKTDLVTTRLGQGIERRYLLSEAMRRTVSVVKNYMPVIKYWEVKRVVVVATSAVRDAINKEEFLALVFKETGFKVKVLSGEEEARYMYKGVLSGLFINIDRVLIVDVGGGSTEFVWQKDQQIYFKSVNIGAVRIKEGDYNDNKIYTLLVPVFDLLREKPLDLLVGTGGTVTTMAAMAMSLEVYDPYLVHGCTITIEQVEDLMVLLRNTSVEERRRLPGLQPERADVIDAGVRIIHLIMQVLNILVLKVSEADIMHGLALREAGYVERKISGST